MDRVFERFAQAGTLRGSHQTGLGLGLAIVKELCALMDMKIDLKSWENEATVFRLSTKVPRISASAEPQDIDLDKGLKIPAKRLVVLIVDDSKEAREALAELFRSWGRAARSVSSVHDALETLDDLGRPDLVVVDYHLDADTTGLDVITSVHLRYSSIPAIIITDATSTVDLQALAASPFKVFHKPINPIAFEIYLTELFHTPWD